MQRQNIIQVVLFVVFFSIGAAVLSSSILCDDLLLYYRNKQLLKAVEESLNRLESLNTDYDALLGQLRKDPEVVRRIAPATLGTELEDEDTIYPKATVKQLAVARRALTEGLSRQPAKPEIAGWIARCSEPLRRTILFLAGAFLVLISFIWFGPARQENQEG